MADDLTGFDDDPLVLAGAYVLGVLEGEELAAAQRAQLADLEFRAAVEWWEWRLGSMAEAAPAFTPSPVVWRAIEARISAIEAAEGSSSGAIEVLTPQTARPAGWSIATALAGVGMAAAAVALYLSTSAAVEQTTPTIAQAPRPQLVAQVQDEVGERRLVGRYDSASRQLALSITGLEAEEGKAPELWVIPEGGAPISLGSIPETGEFERDLDEADAALLQRGAMIAVTFEDATGERHETPTPPILLAGALDQV